MHRLPVAMPSARPKSLASLRGGAKSWLGESEAALVDGTSLVPHPKATFADGGS